MELSPVLIPHVLYVCTVRTVLYVLYYTYTTPWWRCEFYRETQILFFVAMRRFAGSGTLVIDLPSCSSARNLFPTLLYSFIRNSGPILLRNNLGLLCHMLRSTTSGSVTVFFQWENESCLKRWCRPQPFGYPLNSGLQAPWVIELVKSYHEKPFKPAIVPMVPW